MNLRLLLLGMLFGITTLSAQKQISGIVIDNSTNEPLIGASVQVEGTNLGVITDIDGTFSIEVPAGASRLLISYIGFTNQTIDIGNQTNLTINLVPGQFIQEVVVIGYGTVKREDATGSMQVVSSEKFNKGAITSASELLTGKIAGLTVNNSSEPGGGAVIRIRGGSSLSASNDPLIVIDGVPVSNDGITGDRNVLNIVNPNDIESVTVLKDASATAIYGSRASNGVILITTKKSRTSKKLAVDYSGSYAVSNRLNEINALNADEFRTYIRARYPDSHPAQGLLGDANTDWQDLIFQTGQTLDQNISFSGTAGVLPYRLSLGYTDRTGILKTDAFNRKTAALKLTPKFLENTLQFIVDVKGMLINNRFADWGAIGSAAAFNPTVPVYDNGVYGGYYTFKNADGNPNTLAPANPLALLELRDNSADVKRLITNFQVDYRLPFLHDLRANLNLAMDDSRGEGLNLVAQNASWTWSDKGSRAIYDQDKTNKLLEFYLNYGPRFGKYALDLVAGYSWQHFFKEDHFKTTNFLETKILTPENYNPAEYYLLSLFGRANLNISDRYLFTFTLRRDGTSRFSEENRWGLFPAGAFAWKILNNGTGDLNSLKLRLGYGITGQQGISDADYYNYLPRYLASFDNAKYQFGNEFISTLRPQGYDANIKWEETTTYNAGLDIGLFKDRISANLDVYHRVTNDLLNFVPVPAGTNLTNFLTTNVGDLTNTGVELGINTIALRDEKQLLEIGINATLNRNKITRLTATDDPNYVGVFTGGIPGGVGNTIQVHSVGFPANSYLVYEQVYDHNNKLVEGLYVDRNGDGLVTPADRYRYKKPAADLTLGLSASYSIGNFDVSTGVRGSYGNFVYNSNQANRAVASGLYGSTGILYNTTRDIWDLNINNVQLFSDHFVQDASFVRMDHLTAGYNFKKINWASRLRLSLTVQNPFLITKYTGIDPEVYNTFAPGVDGDIYPRTRTFLLGVSASF